MFALAGRAALYAYAELASDLSPRSSLMNETENLPVRAQGAVLLSSSFLPSVLANFLIKATSRKSYRGGAGR
jgi:hypothetical protein